MAFCVVDFVKEKYLSHKCLDMIYQEKWIHGHKRWIVKRGKTLAKRLMGHLLYIASPESTLRHNADFVHTE